MDRLNAFRAVGASAALLLATTTGAPAQEEAPLPGDEAIALPATINPGVCGEGGDLAAEPAYELGLVGPTVGEDESVPLPDEVRGLQLSPPVMTLEETIDATFADLLGDTFAVVVRSGEEGEGERFIACGQLGGVVGEGRLAVGLRPLSEERYFGVAVLEDASRATDLEEGQLLVTVYLFQEQGPIGPLGEDEGDVEEAETE